MQYLQATTSSLKDGILPSSARDEIVTSSSTLIMLYTTHPPAKKLERVAERARTAEIVTVPLKKKTLKLSDSAPVEDKVTN